MKSRLEIVIEVLHGGGDASLATQSLAMVGYPFVTTVQFATDERQRPLLLISRLAEHTRNLAADPRASLMVRAAGKGADVARATLVGRFEAVAASPLLIDRFLRYQPEAERFLQLGDFAFYRMEIERIRTIGGFGQAAWLEGRRLSDGPWLPLESEAGLLATLEAGCLPDATLLGADCFGLDLSHRGERLRLAYAEPCGTAGLAAVLASATAVLEQFKFDNAVAQA